ncbi:MAG: polysaccharide pyruvyl transferase family protein [Rhodospirillaceae bacterium]
MTTPARAATRYPQIALYGYYGCGNLGDDLLLAVAVAELRRLIPGVRFLVRDHGDVAGLERLGPDMAFTHIDAILSDRSRSRPERLIRYLAAWFRLLGGCDWLVFGGGTVFHTQGGLVSLLLQCCICGLARLRGVRIAALGVGVADLKQPAARWLLRRIIALCDLFLVRDDAGLAQCRGGKARLTDDLVFSWTGLASDAGRAHPGGSGEAGIGFSVCPAAFPPEERAAAVAAMAALVRLWRQRGHRVVFLAFWKRDGADDDRALLREINQRLGPDQDAEIRILTAEPGVIDGALKDIDLVCGMRFHGLVLAALAGRAFAGLAHDNKISEICRSFGMPWLALGDFTAERFAAAVDYALTQAPDPALLKTRIAGAHDNFRLLGERL